MMVVRIITARYGDSSTVARSETRARWQPVKIGKTRDRVAIFATFLRSARDQGWVPTMVRSPPFTTFWRRLARRPLRADTTPSSAALYVRYRPVPPFGQWAVSALLRHSGTAHRRLPSTLSGRSWQSAAMEGMRTTAVLLLKDRGIIPSTCFVKEVPRLWADSGLALVLVCQQPEGRNEREAEARGDFGVGYRRL